MVESTQQVDAEENYPENTGPKHQALADEKAVTVGGDQVAKYNVEALENKYTQNVVSPFINNQRTWHDTEHFEIPGDIIKGIVEECEFIKPSTIQAVSIPLIVKPIKGVHIDLIAQSKNGSGKTGAFSIGSMLRVDRNIPKTQVLTICHVRELCLQTADVYEKLCKHSGITVTNYTMSGKSEGQQIVVTTLGKLNNALKGRKPTFDLSEVKCVVIDEADIFFKETRNLQALTEVVTKHFSRLSQKIQYILFSATYSEDVKKDISSFIAHAQQIVLKKENLALNHIQQFEFCCEKGKKPEFMKEIFAQCQMTQTIIFVNTKKFAETLHNMMRKEDVKSTIIFGDMDWAERDEMIAKFKSEEISVIITTNMLARGMDFPQVQIVINFDVPTQGPRDARTGDHESYLHRIGRTGRFGTPGIALTIYDREEEKQFLDQIMDYYGMQNKLKTMTASDQLKILLEEINEAYL